MKTIWKYQLLPIRRHSVPVGGKVLKADHDGEGHLSVWIEVDPSAPCEDRRFLIFGTGHLVPLDGVYIGTVREGPFIWHVYEVPA